MYNRSELSKAIKQAKAAKPQKKPKDVEVDLTGNGYKSSKNSNKPALKLYTDSIYNPTDKDLMLYPDNGFPVFKPAGDISTTFFPGANSVTEVVKKRYGGYTSKQITHFQDGGNMDPGNNALELHMFYDKDLFEDGGQVMDLTEEEIDQYKKGGYIVEYLDDPSIPELTQAQDGGQQSIIEKSKDESETFAYANKDVEKKHKALLDKTRALMDTAQGRKLWYNELKPQNFSIKELSRFVKGVDDYNKEAQAYERTKRRMEEGKVSTDTYAQLYNQHDWSRFDPATMREGYKGQWQDAANEAQKRKEANMAYTDAALEFTGAPALQRIINDPKGTLKGVGNTAADIVMSGTPGVGSIFGVGNPTINPLTGNEYWSGLDETMDVLGVLPGIGAAGKLAKTTGLADDLSRAGKYLTTQTPLKNAYKINPWAFKPDPEAYYRVLGKEGVNDALESGIIRANQKNLHPFSGEPIYDRPYFSKGVPLDRDWKSPFVNKKGKQSVGSVYPDETMVEVFGHNRFNPTNDLVTSPSVTLTPFDEGVNLYQRDWLKGYKPVEVPRQLPGSPNAKFTADLEEATFLKPQESYFQPQTDYEKELFNQVNEYYNLKTSPENLKRAQALDAEFGTNYSKALQDLIFQKANKNVADKYPFNIKVIENPGDGTGAYSGLTSEGLAKQRKGIPTTINDREIGIYSDAPIKDIRRRIQHELGHHTTLSQNNTKALENAWGKKLSESLESPGEISKTNPELANRLIQPAWNSPDSPTLFEYISDPAEVDDYINTTFRDELVQKGILKNHLDELDDNKLALYFMHDAPKDKVVEVLLDVIKPKELLEIFNKGIYALPGVGVAGALMNDSQPAKKSTGGTIMDLSDEEIKKYRDAGYVVVE